MEPRCSVKDDRSDVVVSPPFFFWNGTRTSKKVCSSKYSEVWGIKKNSKGGLKVQFFPRLSPQSKNPNPFSIYSRFSIKSRDFFLGRIIFFEDFGGRDYGFFFGGGGGNLVGRLECFLILILVFFKKKKGLQREEFWRSLLYFSCWKKSWAKVLEFVSSSWKFLKSKDIEKTYKAK